MNTYYLNFMMDNETNTTKEKIRKYLLAHPHLNPYKFNKQTIKRTLPFILFRIPTNRLRILPDFLIIGGQKCGTGSLSSYLKQHHCVYPANMKEVHFFDNNYSKNLSWYRAHFPTKIYKNFKIKQKECFVSGEATAFYLFHPLAPKRVAKLIPDVKLIVILRNPVDRAYSQYQHNLRLKRETLSFDEAIKMEEKRLDADYRRINENANNETFSLWFHSYLSMGRYVEQLVEWDKYFSKEQILILNTDELSQCPQKILKEVFSHLGLEEFKISNFTKYNVGKYSQMNPETRKYLIEYFKPHNEKLYNYLKKDFGWK